MPLRHPGRGVAAAVAVVLAVMLVVHSLFFFHVVLDGRETGNASNGTS